MHQFERARSAWQQLLDRPPDALIGLFYLEQVQNATIKVMVKKQTNTIYEILGWIGVALVLGSYMLIATGIVSSESWIYHSLVFVGSVFIIIISYKKRVFQPVVLNAVLAVFAIIALTRVVLF